MESLSTRVLGSKKTSLLGLAGALLGVGSAWQLVTPEQATALASVLGAVGLWLKE